MIKRIKWDNYNVLGNLELDFTKNDGTAYNTIILAGENGVGKTSILESISEFLNLGAIELFEYINYDEYSIFCNEYIKSFNSKGAHIRKNVKTNDSENIFNTKEKIEKDLNDIRHYGCVYSKARSDFKLGSITNITNLQLDSNKFEKDNKDDYTSIKQLLVDLNNQDCNTLMRKMRDGEKIEIEEFDKQESKLNRFENAFNNFFEELKFKEIDDMQKDGIKIIFEKNNNKIDIDELSMGEKQIVFRGAHLLKNNKSIENGTVLIDEPELSMHPKWQEKVLDYYRGLFFKNGQQNVQMIIATHSEYVLRAALEDRDNVLIIVLENENGVIKNKRIIAPTVLPTVTAAETNYLAFGIISNDYHIELYGYLQTKENKDTIKKCDEFIEQSSLYDSKKHFKQYTYRNITYKTLPTYIRNAIDHPDSGNTYTKEELKKSIELLVGLCK